MPRPTLCELHTRQTQESRPADTETGQTILILLCATSNTGEAGQTILILLCATSNTGEAGQTILAGALLPALWSERPRLVNLKHEKEQNEYLRSRSPFSVTAWCLLVVKDRDARSQSYIAKHHLFIEARVLVDGAVRAQRKHRACAPLCTVASTKTNERMSSQS